MNPQPTPTATLQQYSPYYYSRFPIFQLYLLRWLAVIFFPVRSWWIDDRVSSNPSIGLWFDCGSMCRLGNRNIFFLNCSCSTYVRFIVGMGSVVSFLWLLFFSWFFWLWNWWLIKIESRWCLYLVGFDFGMDLRGIWCRRW